MKRVGTIAAVAAAAALMLGIGGALGVRQDSRPAAAEAGAAPRVDRLAATISRAQERLARLPGDYDTWALLGVAYVERARVSADPGY
jgi:cytochrome c-type biogenesis protein CcmH/NrfG